MVSTSTPRSARSFAVTAMHQGACTRLPNGVSTQMRQSPSSSRQRSITMSSIAGHAAGGGGLLFEIAQQVLGGVLVEAVFFHQAREGDGARHVQQLARHFADLRAELGRASGAIAMPEGHLAGLAGRGRDDDAIVRDLLDAPGGGAENDGVAGAALEDHLFIQFADARAASGAGQEDGEQAAIGNGAAVDDGDVARALRAR